MRVVGPALALLIALLIGMSCPAHAVIDFRFLSRDNHDPDADVMDANLGVSALQVEDFEDAQLLDGFTLTINNTTASTWQQNGTYTDEVPFITRSQPWYWDSSGIIASELGTITVTFDTPVSVFGIGLSGYVDGPTGITFRVNGGPQVAADSIPGVQVYVRDNGDPPNLENGRNAYLLIKASSGDAIHTVELRMFAQPSDGGTLDHMAFAPGSVIPPLMGSQLGGAGVPGGVDFSFSSDASGVLTASFAAVPIADLDGAIPEPFNFGLPTDPVHLWELNFAGTFSSVTLTFGYDDAACCLPFFREESLVVFHLVENEWVPLPATRDTLNNRITVTVDSLSPFLLGAVAPIPALDSRALAFTAVALLIVAAVTLHYARSFGRHIDPTWMV